MKKAVLDTEIHEKEPEGFLSKVQVVACYLEIDNKILLLQRASLQSEGGKWGVPAGKLEKNETIQNAAIRELFEETSININRSTQIQYLRSLYIRKPEVDYIYHLFKVQLDEIPDVHLSDEHQHYLWVSWEDLDKIPLMDAAKEAFQCYRASLKKHASASVSTYLILQQNNKILFHLRKNTGYCDDMWGLVAGHVEEGETATAAMIREAHEEIGIELLPSQIKVVHVMHRKSNRLNVDLFFDCSSWKGTIKNREPHKCEKLEFFSLDALPSNTVPYAVTVLKAIQNKVFYSEEGWDS